jgi:hypothetical protein
MNATLQPRRVRHESGAAALEFAVVLPILLMILFGILEFGRIMMVCHMLTTTAREGVRQASLPGADTASVMAVITNELSQAGLMYDSCELDPPDISTANRDDPVTVRVRINYESIAWVPGFFPGLTGIQLEGVAVMRKEGFG